MLNSSSQDPRTRLTLVAWQRALELWGARAVTTCLFLGVLKIVLEPLLRHVPWMTYEEDDFFYYLKIAQNIAHGAGSTFNGIVPTNGYHPLWLAALVVLSLFTSRPACIQIFLAVCIFTATMCTYSLSRAVMRYSGADDLAVSGLAAYIALYSVHIFTGGMEVILTVPLLLAVLLVALKTEFWWNGFRQSACLGLLLSAMILSRLDSALFAVMLFVSLLLHSEQRRAIRPRIAAGLALGLVPVALYLASNQLWFHTWLPVSGMAKQLKFDHLPSEPAIRSLLRKRPSQLISVVPSLLAILLLPALYKRLSGMQKVLYPATILFPFLYLALLSCLSDWQLWDWYFYPMRPALCGALAMFLVWRPTARVFAMPLVRGAIAAIVLLAFQTHVSTGAQYELYEIADDVRNFAMTHPGRFAMGDRSGMVAYLLPDPLVQTEGLVMDRDFLNDIRRQLPLRTVLRQYGVRYYIATTYPPYTMGCFHAVEPQQAGRDSPHMSAEFCGPPAAVFQQSNVRTMIYDLDQNPAPPSHP